MANPQNLKPFPKGKSGNIGGRSKLHGLIERKCRAAGEHVVEMLMELTKHDDPRIRLEAGKQILDRGFGKPQTQAHHVGQVDHVVSVNQHHLAAVKELSRQALDAPALEHQAEDAVVLPPTRESSDSAKSRYAESKKASEPTPRARASLSH